MAGFAPLLAALVMLVGCKVKGSVQVGGACTIDQTCLSGVCLRESKVEDDRAWIGGYCSGNCRVNGCPQGICLDMADGGSYCVSECASSKDCRAGYLCSPDAKACLPDCRLGWSCGPLLTCDPKSGACALPEVKPLPLGSPCVLNVGCQGGLCIAERPTATGTSWQGGTCSQDCASSSCPSDATCLTFQDGNSRCLTACSAAKDCRPGYVCSSDAKACLPDCRLGWPCGSSLTCDSSTGACTGPTVTPQPLGSPCTLNVGCEGGLCIPESASSSGTNWTAGTCTQDCASSSCPSGATCLTFQDGNSRCLTSCSGPTCRQGYVCSSDAKACLPDCRLGWSCGSLVCDKNTGACSAPEVTPQPLGSPCTLNAGCEGGLCIPESPTSSGKSWLGGTCTQDCASASCPSGATCFAFQDGTSRCLTACSGPTCRTGYVCSSDTAICLPDCRLGWSCGSLVCDTTTGECESTLVSDAGTRLDADTSRDVRPNPWSDGSSGSGGRGGGGFGPGPGGQGGPSGPP